MEHKECTRCRHIKPLTDFTRCRDNIDGVSCYCRNCTSELRKVYVSRNKKKIALQRAIKAKTPAERIGVWRRHLKKKYGISVAQYDILLKRQNSCCGMCGTPQAQLKNRLGVDKVGNWIRGLLCNKCKTAIGLLGGSLQRVEKVYWYLKNTIKS